MIRDAVIGALGIALLLVVLSYITLPTEANKVVDYEEVITYRVERIEQGDLILVNQDGSILLPMEQAFKYDIDVNAGSMLKLYVDKHNDIVMVKEVE